MSPKGHSFFFYRMKIYWEEKERINVPGAFLKKSKIRDGKKE
jgi:hypothetical protein